MDEIRSNQTTQSQLVTVVLGKFSRPISKLAASVKDDITTTNRRLKTEKK
jgi:hypothetical protein